MGPPTQAADSPPDETIERAVEMLAVAIEQSRSGADHDRQPVIDVIIDFMSRYTDMQGATRVILSQHWKTATPGQRNRFQEALDERVVDLVYDVILEIEFDKVSVEPFQGDVEEFPVSVKVSVPMNDGSIIKFDFRMHDRRGDWRILDVVVEGVSYLKLYQSETRQDVAIHGLDRAIDRFTK